VPGWLEKCQLAPVGLQGAKRFDRMVIANGRIAQVLPGRLEITAGRIDNDQKRMSHLQEKEEGLQD